MHEPGKEIEHIQNLIPSYEGDLYYDLEALKYILKTGAMTRDEIDKALIDSRIYDDMGEMSAGTVLFYVMGFTAVDQIDDVLGTNFHNLFSIIFRGNGNDQIDDVLGTNFHELPIDGPQEMSGGYRFVINQDEIKAVESSLESASEEELRAIFENRAVKPFLDNIGVKYPS